MLWNCVGMFILTQFFLNNESMEKQFYVISYAGLKVYYTLRYPDAAVFFGWHIKPYSRVEGSILIDDVISLSESLRRKREGIFYPGTKDAFKEYRILVEPTGKLLSLNRRFIMHAVAFIWKERAWLFTAPSGTGKTTQYLNWKNTWPEEVEILCGDMPVLEWKENEQIWVHPSPWNGSEQFGKKNHKAAPLGGIVYLAQGVEDRICKADFHRLAKPLWHKMIGQADTEEQICARAAFLDHMCRKYPVWMLVNRGDVCSAVLTRAEFETCFQEERS